MMGKKGARLGPLALGGVLPPVATPFRNQEIFLEALKRNLERYNTTGLSGYLILGSNGEASFLDERERREILMAARKHIPEDRIYMAGTGRESTRETIRWTNLAADAGADCALIVPPHYYRGRMTPDILRDHYTAVANASRIPILLYNVPQFTGINFAPSLVASLSRHPNIVGIKDSSGNIGQLSEIIRTTPDDFAVFVGSAPVFYPALCVGAVGGILAVANVIPDACVAIKHRFDAGDDAGAREQQFRITPLARWVTTEQGIGGLKAAMDAMGYEGGSPRAPLVSPGATDLQALKKLLTPFSRKHP